MEEFVLKRLQKATFFNVMADECTDTTTLEELSVFCCCGEVGVLELLPLKKTDAETIYLAL